MNPHEQNPSEKRISCMSQIFHKDQKPFLKDHKSCCMILAVKVIRFYQLLFSQLFAVITFMKYYSTTQVYCRAAISSGLYFGMGTSRIGISLSIKIKSSDFDQLQKKTQRSRKRSLVVLTSLKKSQSFLKRAVLTLKVAITF